MKALIVDDNADDRKLLKHICLEYGFEVTEAANGKEGLEAASKYMPDIIISDAMMSVMDGFEFLSIVKHDRKLKKIPFVFYSAVFTGKKEKELAENLGADALFIKPVEPDEFMEKLNSIIKKHANVSVKPSKRVRPDDEKKYLSKYSKILVEKLESKINELENEVQERKNKEAELERLYKEWGGIFQAIENPVFILDVNHTILAANRAAIVLTGKTEEFLFGKKCHEIMHGTQYAPKGCPLSRIIESGNSEFNEMEIEVFGRTFLVSCTPIFDKSGEIEKIIHISTDITEKKKAAAEKAELEMKLIQSQKMEAVGQLAGGIAHDFNNILTAIITYSHFLKLKMKDSASLMSYVDNILDLSEKAASLTKNLLAFSRKQVLNTRPVRLNDILRNVENILTRVLGEDIEVRTEKGGEGGIVVMADSGQIEQVIMNLATNSRDAMPGGGILTITTGIEELDRAFVKKYGNGKEGRYGVISVADNGTGMDSETRARIFEPFFTTKETGKGTGLGLAMVYGIVKQHGGYIEVFSEKGKGSEFRIYLPLSERAYKEPTSEDFSSVKRGGETILLAEDNPEVRASISSMLEEFGYKVIEAMDGEEMVRKFKKHNDNIQLLIIDMVMPKKNGREAYEEILKIKPGMKAIFVSGYTSEIIMKKGITDAGLDFILKPVSPILLLRKIREILDKAKVKDV